MKDFIFYYILNILHLGIHYSLAIYAKNIRYTQAQSEKYKSLPISISVVRLIIFRQN